MNIKSEKVILMSIEEYTELEQTANRTEEQIERLAEQKAKKISDDNRSKVQLNLRVERPSAYEHQLVTIDTYEELSPQMNVLAHKVQYWSQELLRKEIDGFSELQELKLEVERLNKLSIKYMINSFFGWLMAILLFGIVMAMLAFK